MSVKPKRHLAKAITWRIIASLTTFIIGWVVTGNVHFGMTIGAIDVVIKIALYYFHERIWYHSKFGIVHEDHETDHKTFQLQNRKNKQDITRNKKQASSNN